MVIVSGLWNGFLCYAHNSILFTVQSYTENDADGRVFVLIAINGCLYQGCDVTYITHCKNKYIYDPWANQQHLQIELSKGLRCGTRIPTPPVLGVWESPPPQHDPKGGVSVCVWSGLRYS